MKIPAPIYNTVCKVNNPKTWQLTLTTGTAALFVSPTIDYFMNDGDEKTYSAARTGLKILICSTAGVLMRLAGQKVAWELIKGNKIKVPPSAMKVFDQVMKKAELVKVGAKQTSDDVASVAVKNAPNVLNSVKSWINEIPAKVSAVGKALRGFGCIVKNTVTGNVDNIKLDSPEVRQIVDEMAPEFKRFTGFLRQGKYEDAAKIVKMNEEQLLNLTNFKTLSPAKLKDTAMEIFSKRRYAESVGDITGTFFAICSIFVEARLVNKFLKSTDNLLRKLSSPKNSFDNSKAYDFWDKKGING